MPKAKAPSTPLVHPPQPGAPSKMRIGRHPIHAGLVHFPVAFVLGGLACDAAFWWTGDDFWARAALWIIGAGAFGGAAAATFGMLDFLLVKEIRRFVSSWNHSLVGVTLVSAALTNWWLRLDDPAGSVVPWGLFLSAVSAAAVAAAGYLGGKLVYEHAVGVAE
jgi:uncharacterized membrane protein